MMASLRTAAVGVVLCLIAMQCSATLSSWGEWSHWTECSATCGSGTRTQSRTCRPLGGTCEGSYTRTATCDLQPCCVPEDGTWSHWGEWSLCSRFCGRGSRTRLRTCSEPNVCGRPCEGGNTQRGDCNTQACALCTDTRTDCESYKGRCKEWWMKNACKKTCSLCEDENTEESDKDIPTTNTSSTPYQTVPVTARLHWHSDAVVSSTCCW